MPPTKLHSNLKNHLTQITVTVKTGSLIATEVGRMGSQLTKDISPESCHYLTYMVVFSKSAFRQLFFFWPALELALCQQF